MIRAQQRGLLQMIAWIALLSILLGAVVAKVAAQNIRAPSKIVDASSTIDNGNRRFPLGQIRDGITADSGNFNGFVGRRDQLGSITFTLDAKYDLTAFHIWNDINVRAEGVENFTLRFFSDDQPMHAQKFAGRTGVKPGVVDMQSFRLSRTIKNVNRVILRVDSLLRRPNTYAPQVEIREVAFSGTPSKIDVKSDDNANNTADDNSPVVDPLGPLEMTHMDVPEFERDVVLFFSRAPEAKLRDVASNEGLTVRTITPLGEIGVKMVSAKIEVGDTVAEAVNRLTAVGVVEWAEPNAVFQLLGDDADISRNSGLAMHGLLFGSAKTPPPMTDNAAIVLIDSPVDAANANFRGAKIEQQAVDVPNVPSPHGTAIAELLIGTGDFTGVAQGARLVSLPAFEEVGITFVSTSETLAKAMDAATAMRPHVVNLSFGSKYKSPVLTAYLQQMEQDGICVASAAGNQKGGDVLFPASHPTTLAITAVEQSLRIYEYASEGPEVDIAAWGVGMNAAVPSGRRNVSGTSFATAIISGAMLRMPACSIARDPDAMRKAIQLDADDLGDPGKDETFGSGLFRLGAESLATMEKSEKAPPDPRPVKPIETESAAPVNPLWYAAGGAGAAGGGLLFFLAWRRRREKQAA